ncbi:hypothetical protein D3C80_1442110 [compost metagenome]
MAITMPDSGWETMNTVINAHCGCSRSKRNAHQSARPPASSVLMANLSASGSGARNALSDCRTQRPEEVWKSQEWLSSAVSAHIISHLTIFHPAFFRAQKNGRPKVALSALRALCIWKDHRSVTVRVLPDEITNPSEEKDHQTNCHNTCEYHFVDEHVLALFCYCCLEDGLRLPSAGRALLICINLRQRPNQSLAEH